MNNIRQIITERLENARNDYEQAWTGTTIYDILQGQIEAYQDCLNLMHPRTETDILKDFEALGWIVSRNDEDDFTLRLKGNPTCAIRIDKLTKEYSMSCCLLYKNINLMSGSIFILNKHRNKSQKLL